MDRADRPVIVTTIVLAVVLMVAATAYAYRLSYSWEHPKQGCEVVPNLMYEELRDQALSFVVVGPDCEGNP